MANPFDNDDMPWLTDEDTEDERSDGEDNIDEEEEDDSSCQPDSSNTDTSDMASTDSDSLRHEQAVRTYRGKPCRTMLLQERRRVSTLKRRREVANVGKKQQARDGNVKAFTPKPFAQCCKRRCALLFKDKDDPVVKLASSPLYDTSLSRAEMRDQLQRNAINVLTNTNDDKPVCNKMACIAYSCSTSFLNPNNKRTLGTQGDSNRRRAKTLFSIMSWFQNEQEFSDIMPDTGVYLLSYPTKVSVSEVSILVGSGAVVQL